MKKLLFAVIFLFASVQGYSQFGFGFGFRVPVGGGSSGPRESRNIENHVQQMRKDLNLTKDQVIKVRSLLIERDRRRRGPNPMLGREYNDRLQQILTPDQYGRLVELRQERLAQKQQQGAPAKADSTKQPAPREEDDDIYR